MRPVSSLRLHKELIKKQAKAENSETTLGGESDEAIKK